jgi:hypothetical protein
VTEETGAAKPAAARAEAAARPRLHGLLGVTYAVPDLAAIEDAYVHALHYRVRQRGRVGPATAAAWGAPACAGHPLLTLVPAHGEPCTLRFVQSPAAAGWRALATHGWNATGFVVEDVDALARELRGTAFAALDAPVGLAGHAAVRTLQVLGPAGECLQFVEVGADGGPGLARAESPVGRAFLAAAAGPDVEALADWYAAFDDEVERPLATAATHGQPAVAAQRRPLVKAGGGALLSLHASPPGARERAVAPGELPPGMAIVTLQVERLPAALAAAAYRTETGGRAALARGRAGELLELATA